MILTKRIFLLSFIMSAPFFVIPLMAQNDIVKQADGYVWPK